MIHKHTEYEINVSYTGDPFYVLPTLVDEENIRILRQYSIDVGMYYLFKLGRIVYIGISSKNVWDRILSHINDKDFDSYFIFYCNGDDALLDKCMRAESWLIRNFKPLYNGRSNIALRKATKAKVLYCI